MPLTEVDRRVVESLFRAMQAGPEGEEEMMSLFAEGATLIEPFSGTPRTHVGKDAIRQAFRESFAEPPPPDMKLVLDRADVDGERVRADWTCTSSVFPAPMKGYDLFTIEEGKIQRLEVVHLED